jgi:predicted PurR-regulated permease PerM
MEKKGEQDKLIFYGIVLAVLLLVFFLIKPVINALLGGIILAFIFNPLYVRISRLIRHKTTAALLTLLIVTLIIVVPLGFIINNLVRESAVLFEYSRAVSSAASGECGTTAACKFAAWLQGINSDIRFDNFLKGLLSQVSEQFLMLATRFFGSLPLKMLQMFVLFFSTFVFLKDGKELLAKFKAYLPFKEEQTQHFLKRFKEVSHGVIYGTLVVAVVQAVLATIGFFIFSVEAPLFWGILVFVCATMPFMAPPLVYIPIGVFKILNGIAEPSSNGIFQGVMLIIWGMLIVSLVDNLIRYKITGEKGKVHPLLVLLGIIGGVQLFGIVGIFFGPLVLVFALTLLEIKK